jgi:hypothetical protein
MLLRSPARLRMLHVGARATPFPMHAGPRLDLCLLRFPRLPLTASPLPRACTRAQQLQQIAVVVGLTATCATLDLVLQYLDEILCNIRLKHQENTFVAIAKHMQHSDKTLTTYV